MRDKLQAERPHSVTGLRANSAIELRTVQIELAPDTLEIIHYLLWATLATETFNRTLQMRRRYLRET